VEEHRCGERGFSWGGRTGGGLVCRKRVWGGNTQGQTPVLRVRETLTLVRANAHREGQGRVKSTGGVSGRVETRGKEFATYKADSVLQEKVEFSRRKVAFRVHPPNGAWGGTAEFGSQK